MKKFILITSTLLFALFANAQIVNIPDANFKVALITNSPVIDTNGDGEIQVSEASVFTGWLNISSNNISDITGIEAFTTVSGINCSINNISTIDVSNNTNLSGLYCQYNQLTNLSLGSNSRVKELRCFENQLNYIDVSVCDSLDELNCSNNLLTSLDLSNNTMLIILECNSNQLSELNLQNGNNTLISGGGWFHAIDNPYLFCIQVDNSAWSTLNWTEIDPWASFSNDCSNWVGVNAGDTIYTTCNGNLQLNPIIVYNGPNSLSYSWSPSIGLSNTTIQNPVANPTVTTTYTISVTDGVFSAIDSVTVFIDPLPVQEICMVTVDSVYGKNKIIWEKALLPIEEYYIWKETIISGTYNLMDVVPYDSAGVYVDMASEPQVKSDKYKISVLDSCGYISDMGNYHKTIHLNVSPAVPQGYALTWEHYEGFSFDTYVIYRKNNSNPFDSIASIAYSTGVFTYTDVNPPGGNIYYFIAAQKLTPCDTTLIGTKLFGEPYSQSLSNIEDNIAGNINENIKAQCKIFPNPTTGKITVQAKDMERIEILDFTGKVIENLQGFRNLEGLDIDLSKNPKGIYIIKVTTNKGVAVQKIVLE